MALEQGKDSNPLVPLWWRTFIKCKFTLWPTTIRGPAAMLNPPGSVCFVFFWAEILCIINFLLKQVWEANFNFDLEVNEVKDVTFNGGFIDLCGEFPF